MFVDMALTAVGRRKPAYLCVVFERNKDKNNL